MSDVRVIYRDAFDVDRIDDYENSHFEVGEDGSLLIKQGFHIVKHAYNKNRWLEAHIEG